MLLDSARALPLSIDPERDLWPSIEAEIQRSKLVGGRFSERLAGRGESTAPTARRWLPLAAAAMLLVAVSSAVTAYLMQPPDPGLVGGVGRVSDEALSEFATSSWREFEKVETEYLRVTTELLEALDTRREELAPETIRIVEQSLIEINESIGRARDALEFDPGNSGLARKLNNAYRGRVRLLREITQLSA